GNLYVTEELPVIRKITPVGSDWVVTTIAGVASSQGTNDGSGLNAHFSVPRGIAVDTGGSLYVCDVWTIRRISPDGTNWFVTTIAGSAQQGGTNDGVGAEARFLVNPGALAIDNATNLYVAEGDNLAIRKITPEGANWVVSTIAGWGV